MSVRPFVHPYVCVCCMYICMGVLMFVHVRVEFHSLMETN